MAWGYLGTRLHKNSPTNITHLFLFTSILTEKEAIKAKKSNDFASIADKLGLWKVDIPDNQDNHHQAQILLLFTTNALMEQCMGSNENALNKQKLVKGPPSSLTRLSPLLKILFSSIVYTILKRYQLNFCKRNFKATARWHRHQNH